MKKVIYGVIMLIIVAASCQKTGDETLMDTPQYAPFLPSNFPAPSYDLAKNPVTKSGFILGRKLFYDPILSLDSTISCGFCHIQTSAFTQHGHDVSHGFKDRLGTRNSMPVFNMIWAKSFFWDGGVHNLDFVPINAITSAVEMNETLDGVLKKLNRSRTYPAQFKAVFGSDSITTQTLLKALSQFMASCVSANSRYDKYIRKETGGTLSADELAGLNLVKTKCQSCHATDLFTDNTFRNNGLQQTNDKGRYTVSQLDADKWTFKVPSLRNLSYTAPYMHDGRFRNLDAVLTHYTEGVVESETLDPLLRQANNKLGIPLTTAEKQQILAFLKTLDDETFIRDKRFSEQ